MSVIKKIAKGLFGGVLGLVLGGGGKKRAALPGPATRDDAREMVDADDELRRRKGAAGDMITGVRGAEAAGSVGRLVVGS